MVVQEILYDRGEVSYILRIKVYRDRPKVILDLSQKLYIEKVLKRFRMENFKRGFLPLRHSISLSKTMCPTTSKEVQRMSRISYASTIGSLMYVMLCTRFDIAFAMSVTNKYQLNPDKEHWIAVKNILKYLRRTKDLFLSLEEYLSYESRVTDRKSTRLNSSHSGESRMPSSA